MGMHQDLIMQNFLQSTISSAWFISIPNNNKFNKEVRYIHDNRSWERCYVLLNNIFPCLRVICLADSNHAVMDKFYYYSIMTTQCIEEKISDIDYQEILPDILSPASIWNMSDEESDEEESSSNNYTVFTDNICLSVSKLWS